MDWSIQPFSKKSTASGEHFEAGETVVSFLYKDEAGMLQRMDLKHEELVNTRPPPGVLGRWTHAAKQSPERSQDKQAYLQSAEALFCSLFEEDREQSASQELRDTAEHPEVLAKDKSILKLVLALILERKRILKPLTTSKNAESRSYIHLRSQMTYTIPVLAYGAQDLERIQERLKTLF